MGSAEGLLRILREQGPAGEGRDARRAVERRAAGDGAPRQDARLHAHVLGQEGAPALPRPFKP